MPSHSQDNRCCPSFLCNVGLCAEHPQHLSATSASVSTIPSNGDVNPYGIAFAPKTVPSGAVLQPGDILISNFNNSMNLQGTGTTILRVDKTGTTSTFFTSPQSQSGLTAAPFQWHGADRQPAYPRWQCGDCPARQAGGLRSQRNLSWNFRDSSQSKWTLGYGGARYRKRVSGTANVFMSNVLSGTIVRFDIQYNPTGVSASVVILATGLGHRLDPAALVLGPSGLAYEAIRDVLFVASSADNAIHEIATAAAPHNAALGATLLVSDLTHLHGPLDLTILPNGHLLVATSDGSNADPAQPSELVEYSATGQSLGQMPVDPNNGGAFGVAINYIGWATFRPAAVDDNTNTLNIWTPVIQ